MRDKLLFSRMKTAEYSRTVYQVTPEAETPFDTVISPEYWAHVAHTLNPLDRLEIVPDDFEYFAELMVVGTSTQAAKVVVLRKEDIGGKETLPQPGAEYIAKHKGPAWGWCVIRVSDGEVMLKNFSDRQEATKAANNYAPKAA